MNTKTNSGKKRTLRCSLFKILDLRLHSTSDSGFGSLWFLIFCLPLYSSDLAFIASDLKIEFLFGSCFLVFCISSDFVLSFRTSPLYSQKYLLLIQKIQESPFYSNITKCKNKDTVRITCQLGKPFKKCVRGIFPVNKMARHIK